MSQESITIINRSTNQPVEAILETNLDKVQLIDAEIDWAPARLRALRQLVAQGITDKLFRSMFTGTGP